MYINVHHWKHVGCNCSDVCMQKTCTAYLNSKYKITCRCIMLEIDLILIIKAYFFNEKTTHFLPDVWWNDTFKTK